MTHATVNDRPGQVRRLHRAILALGDNRRLKRELADGNHYALAWITKRGATYENGAIVRRIPDTQETPTP